MNKIPTADELIDQYNEKFKRTGNPYWLREPLKEFAKLHVEAALKAVHKYGKEAGAMNDADLPYILNTYPLNNIV